LRAAKEGYRPENLTGVQAGSTGADFSLEALAYIVGEVVDATTEQPIQQFEVNYATDIGATARAELFSGAEQIESTEGVFEIADLYPGPVTVGVRAEGY